MTVKPFSLKIPENNAEPVVALSAAPVYLTGNASFPCGERLSRCIGRPEKRFKSRAKKPNRILEPVRFFA
jgi:hypothetical protein